MAVNLNTSAGDYAVKTRRIEKFLNAENRDAALRMGGLDKFADLFRTGNNKKAVKIAAIYDSIVAAAPGERTPLTMLDRFHALKSLAASPADKAQLRVNYTAPGTQGAAPDTWGYAFSIGDTTIHTMGEIPDAQGTFARSFEQAMMVRELEHHVGELPKTFKDSEAARSIDDRYFTDKISIMAYRTADGLPQARLRESLDDGFFCADNLVRVEQFPPGGPLVATFSAGGKTENLEFNGESNRADPLQPCGATLKRWLEERNFSSIRNLIESKARTVEDNKSVNDFSGLSKAIVQDVHTAIGRPVDALSLINGSLQTELAEAIRAVYEERPETAAPTIAALFNMKVEGYTDRDPNFAVRMLLGSAFCDSNQAFLDQARQLAAQSLAAARLEEADAPPQAAAPQVIPAVPDLRSPRGPADQFLAEHLVNFRTMNILGTVVGGGARPAERYLIGATQDEVLAKIREAGFTTILSIDQGGESQDLTAAIERAGLTHEIGDEFEFPDWEYSTPDLYLTIKGFIEEKAAAGERVFIHCGAGNGRTGAVLSALVLSDLVEGERARRQARGEGFTLEDYARTPRLEMSTEYVVRRDQDGEFLRPEKQATSAELPFLAAHAVQSVRDAVQDNPGPKGMAVETNEQLLDVNNFAQYLLPSSQPQFV